MNKKHNENKIQKIAELTVQWIGDISLNGAFCDPSYHAMISDNLQDLSQELGSTNLRIANLESPIWGNGGVNVLKMPRLATTFKAAQCLLPLNINVALLANNHVYDCLEKGFENTIGFLDEHKIQWLGAGTSKSQAEQPLILKKNKVTVGLLNYVDYNTNPSIPQDAGIFLNMLDSMRALGEVKELASQVDFINVNLHWGAFEIVQYPTITQRTFARQLIEAGAKVVTCTHSHCLQGYEQWESGHIFYGLGNFLFDCFGGKPNRKWPEISRRTGIAQVITDVTKIKEATISFLYQESLTLKQDNRSCRKRHQDKLNNRLKLGDNAYKVVWRLSMLWNKIVLSFVSYVYESGGIFEAICNIRKDQIQAVWHYLFTKSDKA